MDEIFKEKTPNSLNVGKSEGEKSKSFKIFEGGVFNRLKPFFQMSNSYFYFNYITDVLFPHYIFSKKGRPFLIQLLNEYFSNGKKLTSFAWNKGLLFLSFFKGNEIIFTNFGFLKQVLMIWVRKWQILSQLCFFWEVQVIIGSQIHILWLQLARSGQMVEKYLEVFQSYQKKQFEKSWSLNLKNCKRCKKLTSSLNNVKFSQKVLKFFDSLCCFL